MYEIQIKVRRTNEKNYYILATKKKKKEVT